MSKKDKNNNEDKIIISEDYDDRFLNDEFYDNESNNTSDKVKNGKSKKKKKKPKKKGFGFYFKWTVIVLLILTIVTGCVGIAIAYSWVKDAELNMSNFEYLEPSTVLDVNGDPYQELQGKEKRDIVDIDDVPEHVKNAFISIEDERFYSHNGVDIQGLIRAGLGVITSGSLEGPGGSTITQQLIKLTHLSPEKKIERKVVEMYLAIQLEQVWTKDQILEAYLNKVGFANAWGIQAACQTYFRKDVQDISVAQAAVLAAIIKSPTYYKPYLVEEVEEGIYEIMKDDDGKIVYNERNQNRALAVVDKMYELGHISKEEHDTATEQIENNDFDLHEPPETEIYSYFTDELYVELIDDLMESEDFSFDSEEEAENYLLNSGLKIYSTIDPEVQEILDEKFQDDSLFPQQSSAAKQASEAMSEELGKEVNYMPEGAMTIIDNSNGYVVGMIGGRDKDNSRSLNRATTKFQVGSATKPLTVYAPGLESKTLTLATTYDDVPISIGSWKPKNAGSYEGMVTVREGLTESKNVVAAQAWMDVGVENSVKYAELLGLKIEESDKTGAALALGGYTYGQTTLDMSSAFSTFANDGTRIEPILYTKVEDRDGNVVLENKQEKIRVFSEETAYLITDVLKDVVRGGTTSISVPNMDVAGKTGTTNDLRHAYFAGYTPYYTAAVWYGYDENKVQVDGKTYYLNIGVYGGTRPTGPASMWQEVMREIHEDLESKKFSSRPQGIVTASIDTVSGKLPTELSAEDPRGSTVRSEMFISGTVPTSQDDYHVKLLIDTSTGKIATEYCPENLVEEVVFIVKPDNRFPSGVKPLDPDYVPEKEKDVLAPAEDDICELHTANTPVGIKILSNNQEVDQIELEVGETADIKVVGLNTSSQFVSVDGLSVTSSNGNVSVTLIGDNTYRITAVSSGSSIVTATLSYNYEDKTISYSDNVSILVTQVEEEPPVSDPDDENPGEGNNSNGSSGENENSNNPNQSN